MVSFFGFVIKKEPKRIPPTPVSQDRKEDATVISSGVGVPGGAYGTAIDLEGIIKTENDLLGKYRQIAQYSDCTFAIQEIVNDAIVFDDKMECVSINLDDTELSDPVKEKIQNEFAYIKDLLDFETTAHELFRQWYVDGRIYFHIIMDEENLNEVGIMELRQVDPRKIRKIKDERKERDPQGGFDVIVDTKEYYIFNNKGINENNVVGIVLPVDSVVHVSSGEKNPDNGITISYLNKAIKPVNNLKIMEDSMVIYRISRAPERRVFYVDVGNMPKQRAEQYVHGLMQKYRNRITYDSVTGNVRDDKRHLSTMDDFWMPRREGGKGTEITTLPGGENLDQIADIEYFQQKLFRALEVPIGRLQPQQGFTLGRSTEITRDEVKFYKFIQRVRRTFSDLFSQALRVQLIAKGVMDDSDWQQISKRIRYDYIEDNHFSELKTNEIMQARLTVLQMIDPYIGRFYSQRWIKLNVLHQSEKEIMEIQKEIEDEAPELEQMGKLPGQDQGFQGNQPVDPAMEDEGGKGPNPALTKANPMTEQ